MNRNLNWVEQIAVFSFLILLISSATGSEAVATESLINPVQPPSQPAGLRAGFLTPDSGSNKHDRNRETRRVSEDEPGRASHTMQLESPDNSSRHRARMISPNHEPPVSRLAFSPLAAAQKNTTGIGKPDASARTNQAGPHPHIMQLESPDNSSKKCFDLLTSRQSPA